MQSAVMNFIINAFSGAVGLVDRIISGIPGGETAIVWGAFVTLGTGFLIIPIRGAGFSDLAKARLAHKKSRASEED